MIFMRILFITHLIKSLALFLKFFPMATVLACFFGDDILQNMFAVIATILLFSKLIQPIPEILACFDSMKKIQVLAGSGFGKKSLLMPINHPV